MHALHPSGSLRRWEILIGKWLGFAGMMAMYVTLMVGGLTTLAYGLAGARVHHLLRGVALIWFECLLVLTLTLLFGATRSTLTSGVLALGLHGMAFIGGWIARAGTPTLVSPPALSCRANRCGGAPPLKCNHLWLPGCPVRSQVLW